MLYDLWFVRYASLFYCSGVRCCMTSGLLDMWVLFDIWIDRVSGAVWPVDCSCVRCCMTCGLFACQVLYDLRHVRVAGAVWPACVDQPLQPAAACSPSVQATPGTRGDRGHLHRNRSVVYQYNVFPGIDLLNAHFIECIDKQRIQLDFSFRQKSSESH